jgi:hypothetical protein
MDTSANIRELRHELSIQSGAPDVSYNTTNNFHEQHKYEPRTCLPDSFQARLKIASSCAKRLHVQTRLELHPSQPGGPLLPYFPVILLNFIFYLSLYLSVYILKLDFIIINMKPAASQVRNRYS